MELILQEFEDLLLEDEVNELKSHQYDEVGIDKAIERVKDIDTDIDRLKAICTRRIEELKFDLEQKVKRLNKKKQWDLVNIYTVVKNAPDKKETKTQFKKQYLSGDVIIKKEAKKMLKPDLTEDIIKQDFPDYKKDKTELNWAELKKNCIIDAKGRVVNTTTGEDLSDIIQIEIEPEEIIIK